MMLRDVGEIYGLHNLYQSYRSLFYHNPMLMYKVVPVICHMNN